ncbi:tripartite motif-containing protein 2 isoform X3 [Scleropages formosus]|uniref:tripartite motif-containing protein 2 isoform X3 n=1 Tax=Scleropages formosus TaxID=113540 RepID=UPI0010FA8540|nr:tripartite motif-containing protein 2-like isoform X3 [Scleropages formosus]
MEEQQRSPDSSSEDCTVLENVAAGAARQALSCPSHGDNAMELYCSPCDTAVCKECTKGEHAEHAAVPLRDAVEQHRVRLQDQLETTKKRLPEINSAMRSLTEFQQQLSSQKASIEEDIHSTFEDLQKTLNVRKSVLLMELEVTYGLKQKVREGEGTIVLCLMSYASRDRLQTSMTLRWTRSCIFFVSALSITSKDKVLQSQLDTLLQGQEEIHDCCSVTEQGLSCSSEAEVLLLKKQMSERLAELASHQYPLQPQENDQLDFLVETEGLKKSVHNLGTIVTTSAVAYETEASGEGLRQCVVGHPTSVIITTKDKDGEPCKTGSASVTAEIFTPDGSVADGEILDNKNGTYEFLYTVPKEGSFTLSLRLYDQHIKGSPFKLKVTKSADVSPSTDGAKKRVKSPGSGHVKQRLAKRPASMFSTSKRKENPIEDDMIFRVGTKGRNKGEFTNLQGVAASSDGNILIADSNNQCVQIFSNDGQFINRFGVRGRSPGQLQRPTGVAVHPNGDIIIADYDNKWVSIFSNDGKFKELGSQTQVLEPFI